MLNPLTSVSNQISNNIILKIQKAIREEHIDGWLFCNFRHRDRLSDQILFRPETLTNSRFWFYLVPASGEPLALVHTIEPDHLDSLPGKKQSYAGREELLKFFATLSGKIIAVHMSENISTISFLDAGVYIALSGAGVRLVGAENLIQRFKGLLSREGIASHERAASALYSIVEKVWDFVCTSYIDGRNLNEREIRELMEDEFTRLDMERDHPPQAAAGMNSANPHYDFTGNGRAIEEGDIIQLDLWAKEKNPGAIYADIAWAGVYGKKARNDTEKRFSDLVEIRETLLDFLTASFAEEKKAGAVLTGAEIDAYCRSLLYAKGYGNVIKHRTGHGIDTEAHGSGANIDSAEFPDNRRLLEGSCFSIEPGIYFTGYGFRTEVNVYIQDGRPRVSGPGAVKQGRQFKLLHC